MPLFCVHAEAGDVSLYHGLDRYLAREQTVLGLCAQPAEEFGPHPRFEARILGFHVRNLMRLDMDARLAYVASTAGRARMALNAKATAVLRRAGASASPQVAFRDAMAAYVPEPCTGTVVLFSCRPVAARDHGATRPGMGCSGRGSADRDGPRLFHNADLRAGSARARAQSFALPG
jgi:hypothetical protein